MISNLDKYRTDIEALIELGEKIIGSLFKASKKTNADEQFAVEFAEHYQNWYTESAL